MTTVTLRLAPDDYPRYVVPGVPAPSGNSARVDEPNHRRHELLTCPACLTSGVHTAFICPLDAIRLAPDLALPDPVTGDPQCGASLVAFEDGASGARWLCPLDVIHLPVAAKPQSERLAFASPLLKPPDARPSFTDAVDGHSTAAGALAVSAAYRALLVAAAGADRGSPLTGSVEAAPVPTLFIRPGAGPAPLWLGARNLSTTEGTAKTTSSVQNVTAYAFAANAVADAASVVLQLVHQSLRAFQSAATAATAAADDVAAEVALAEESVATAVARWLEHAAVCTRPLHLIEQQRFVAGGATVVVVATEPPGAVVRLHEGTMVTFAPPQILGGAFSARPVVAAEPATRTVGDEAQPPPPAPTAFPVMSPSRPRRGGGGASFNNAVSPLLRAESPPRSAARAASGTVVPPQAESTFSSGSQLPSPKRTGITSPDPRADVSNTQTPLSRPAPLPFASPLLASPTAANAVIAPAVDARLDSPSPASFNGRILALEDTATAARMGTQSHLVDAGAIWLQAVSGLTDDVPGLSAQSPVSTPDTLASELESAISLARHALGAHSDVLRFVVESALAEHEAVAVGAEAEAIGCSLLRAEGGDASGCVLLVMRPAADGGLGQAPRAEQVALALELEGVCIVELCGCASTGTVYAAATRGSEAAAVAVAARGWVSAGGRRVQVARLMHSVLDDVCRALDWALCEALAALERLQTRVDWAALLGPWTEAIGAATRAPDTPVIMDEASTDRALEALQRAIALHRAAPTLEGAETLRALAAQVPKAVEYEVRGASERAAAREARRLWEAVGRLGALYEQLFVTPVPAALGAAARLSSITTADVAPGAPARAAVVAAMVAPHVARSDTARPALEATVKAAVAASRRGDSAATRSAVDALVGIVARSCTRSSPMDVDRVPAAWLIRLEN